MTNTDSIDALTSAFESTKVSITGISFEGKSLKLDTEEDAKPVVDSLNNAPIVEYLNLEGNTLGVDAAKAIAKALERHPKFKRALWRDMFTGRMKTEIPKALQYLGNGLVTAGARLTELDMSDNAFGPIGVEGLASLLRSSSCYALEELRLNNNGLGITGGKLLASALMDCYSSSKTEGKPLALKVFIAGRNRLENDGAKALAQVFKTIGTLKEIAMPQNGIYHVGISALSDAFIHNDNLQVLNLNDNTIGVRGAEAIAKALPSLQKLKEINFGDCLLKTKGAIFLANALKSNHVELVEITLGFNEIHTEGGIALAEAMANKSNLKCLTIDGNQFNQLGRMKIKEKLKQIGKLNVLSSLDECDSDEEEEEEDEGSEQESEDDSNESEDEAAAKADVEKTMASIINNCNGGSIQTKIGNCQEFVDVPTAENFLMLGKDRETIILDEMKKTPDLYITNLLPLLMKVSALSVNNQEEVSKSALNCCELLYKELFTWAQKNGEVSLVTNALLVHLGLIKSEDKNFKTSWNLEGCLLALEKIIKQTYIPDATKDVLRVFMKREIENNRELLSTKKKLLELLNN